MKDEPLWLVEIRNSLAESLRGMLTAGQELIPKIVAMLVILILGYIVALVARRIARNVLSRIGIDAASKRIGLDEVLGSLGIKLPPSQVLGKLFFWSLMLIFSKAAIDVLGMESVTRSFDSLMAYIPNVIAAVVIVVAGLMLGNLLRAMASGAAERFGFDYAHAVGQLVYAAVLVMVGTVAISQLQLQTQIVDRFLEISLMAVGAALALALGFGTRDTARHVVAGVYLRECFPPGTPIVVGEKSGEVVAVQTVNTKIKTASGNLFVPNAALQDMTVHEQD